MLTTQQLPTEADVLHKQSNRPSYSAKAESDRIVVLAGWSPEHAEHSAIA